MVIRVGILGTGSAAELYHIPGYREHPEVRVVACVDQDVERAQRFAKKHEIEKVYADYHEMFEKAKLDIVSICTPNYVHKTQALEALEAEINVLCEKPMAMNAGEAQEMVKAAQRGSALLTIGHQHRFTVDAQILKRFIEAGELGTIYYARAQCLRRAGIPGWGAFHIKAKSGGGVLLDTGVHFLDLMLWLMGHPKPQSVVGATYTTFGNKQDDSVIGWGEYNRAEFDVEDFASALIRFADGTVMNLETCWAANIEFGDKITQQLFGDRGGATLYPLQIFTQRHRSLMDSTPRALSQVNPYAEEIRWLIAAMRGEKELLVKPEQCYQVQRIMDAIYESSATKREVRLS
jgi:predicted dehydrogenase